MWTRKELKEKAKMSLTRNYWKSVLMALLIVIFIGGGGSSINSRVSDRVDDVVHSGSGYSTEDGYYMEYNTGDVLHELGNQIGTTGIMIGLMMAGAALIISLIVLAVTILLEVFIFNPLEVGCRRFFLRNLNEPALIGNVGYAFDNNYKNIAKTMFFVKLYTALWSLLFVIPGIVKSYEYRMIPYLLAENPQMSKEQAFAESRQMMQGQKWNAFVLDLSFIGWMILSGMTAGILGVFYVRPYYHATHAALYEKLRYEVPYQNQNYYYQGATYGYQQQNDPAYREPDHTAYNEAAGNTTGNQHVNDMQNQEQ